MDVNVPGVMATLVAPLVAQLIMLLEPEMILSGSAENEVMVGAEPFPGGSIDEIAELQPASPAQTNRMKTSALRSRPKDLSSGELGLLLQEDLVEPIKVSLQLGELSFQPEFRSCATGYKPIYTIALAETASLSILNTFPKQRHGGVRKSVAGTRDRCPLDTWPA